MRQAASRPLPRTLGLPLMENSAFQRLSIGQRVKCQPAPTHSRQRQESQGHARSSWQQSGSSPLLLAVCRSKFKVVAGPAGPVSSSSFPQGSRRLRFAPSGRLSQPVFRRLVFGLLVGSRPSGQRRLKPAKSELAVTRHFHRCAASLFRRPNPSVKGTSTSGLRPLAAAPYVER